MKKIKNIVVLGIVAIFLTACSVSYPVLVTDNPVGTKVGKASYDVKFGFIVPMDADVGIERAAEDGGITRIATVDFKVTGSLFTTTYTTIVTGE